MRFALAAPVVTLGRANDHDGVLLARYGAVGAVDPERAGAPSHRAACNRCPIVNGTTRSGSSTVPRSWFRFEPLVQVVPNRLGFASAANNLRGTQSLRRSGGKDSFYPAADDALR